jgi:peptidyl-prolyl cis-trans isomerase C
MVSPSTSSAKVGSGLASLLTVAARRSTTVFAAGVLVAAAVGFAYAQTPPADPVIARINGIEIHQSDLALAEDDLGQNIPASDEQSKRDYLIGYLTDMIIVAQAAEARKIPDTADFKQRLAFARNKVLMETILASESQAAVTEPALRKIYDDATKQMTTQPEVHARHILFRVNNPNDAAASKAAEDKVKATIARLKRGEDFATLASALTEDPSGKANGGDLGYFTSDQMVPEFSEVAFKLEKGQISDPIKTQFGWHVLKVEDKRMRQPPPFEQVRGEIETYASRKAQSEFVGKLRADAKVERLDKPAEPKK